MQDIINIFLLNPIGQTFWILWMISVISAFMQQDDKNVVKILIIAHFFWAWHFWFMNIYSWLAIVMVWFLRLILSSKYKKNTKVFFPILILTIALWFLTYEDRSSLLPILASCLWTYWFFFLEKVKLRLVLLLVSSFWFSFHYLHFSIWWVINESIVQMVHLFTIYRITKWEWKLWDYIYKFKSIFTKVPKVDYWRYLAIIDYISLKKRK